ncbi:hypothetical protein ONZ45_g11209 [Pleurotus djamor]|nr:hypothetical protein ONZ45_g11209 [Pleurotus djamor]
MAYQQQPPQYGMQQQQPQQMQHDIVSGEQYRYALTNFRIAHEKVEQQRLQLEEQERQVAALRARIATLEGSAMAQHTNKRQNTVDDFSIKNAASHLDKLINRWAAEVIREPPASLEEIAQAVLNDVPGGPDAEGLEPTPMIVQNLLRHAMSECISEGIINCLIVTNSAEANVQLTRIHEHIFARDPTVACVWRRQTFSAAVEACTPEMSLNILSDQVPSLMEIFKNQIPTTGGQSVLDHAYDFSRMLHASNSSAGGTSDVFYRAFVPELGGMLYPRQIELVKRCLKNERGEPDCVGATIFPGLVKVSRVPSGESQNPNMQAVVRRAQVVCLCALTGQGMASQGNMMQGMPINGGMHPNGGGPM